MLYFNKLTKIINAEINEIKNDPVSFIYRVLLNFIISIFVGFLFILLFVYSLYTLINPFVLILFSVIILLSLFWLKIKIKLNFSEKNIIILIAIVWILVQLLVVISIEVEYSNIKDHYSQEYLSTTIEGVDEVNATWSIIDSFDNEYNGVYGVKDSRIPSRQISNNVGSMILSFNPILFLYFFNFKGIPVDGYSKLIFVQNTGNCGEFASSIKFLIKDITGFDTRIIHMEGKDHAFPEINIDNYWWVFNKIYTTPSQPIKSNDYASFLSTEDQSLFNCISDLRDYENEESVLSDHGFNSSNLTITAIKDITVYESDNEPMNNANVEIFAYVNSYDPLVNIGKTDENGQYSTILRSDKKYLILVKNEKLKAIGFKDLRIPLNDNSSITVYLHKYD